MTDAAPATPPPIRPIVARDLDALKAMIDATGLFPSEMLDDMVADFLAGDGDEQLWLTFDEALPMAVAYCAPEHMTSGTWNLYLIAVDPDHQGQGRGSALLAHVEHLLASTGQRVLLIETSSLPEFSHTRAFYARRGYDQEARIRDFYQAGEDKLVFRKALTPADGQML